MEGLQIEIQLDNCANVVKYQFVAYPATSGHNNNEREDGANADTEMHYYQPNLDWSIDTQSYELQPGTQALISYQKKESCSLSKCVGYQTFREFWTYPCSETQIGRDGMYSNVQLADFFDADPTQ